MATNPYPKQVMIEDIPIDAFPDKDSLLKRIVAEIRRPEQSLIMNLNVHAANIAEGNPRFKALLQQADMNFCDGAGVKLAAKLLGDPIPMRHTMADWLADLLWELAENDLTVYFLGGEVGITDRAVERLAKLVPDHTIVGHHHGYILRDEALEQKVIDEINRLKPDLLFGMPIQEYWIDKNRHRLDVRAIAPCGAMFDYFAGKVPRCPAWVGNMGMEWLFRLGIEPKRLFHRYVVGNPQFLMRIMKTAALRALPVPRLQTLQPGVKKA
jgi:N-acetylglucosaminyldiphosphoundecaprenol N-acetyl-beta-D-mannosaminyltransferase